MERDRRAGLPLLDFLEENGLRGDLLHLWEGRAPRREGSPKEWWLEFKQEFMEGMAILGFSFLLYLPQFVLCILLFNKLEPSLPDQYMGHFAFLALLLPVITTWMYIVRLLHEES